MTDHQPSRSHAEPTVQHLADELAQSAPKRVLDVAAGSGRNARPLLERGDQVTAIDRNVDALRELQNQFPNQLEIVAADLEAEPWPIPDRTFDVVLVVNYLWRPLLDRISQSVAPGGYLLYETFMDGNQDYGRPRNPDFLLQPEELRTFAQRHQLREQAFSQGPVGDPPHAVRQFLLARKAR